MVKRRGKLDENDARFILLVFVEWKTPGEAICSEDRRDSYTPRNARYCQRDQQEEYSSKRKWPKHPSQTVQTSATLFVPFRFPGARSILQHPVADQVESRWQEWIPSVHLLSAVQRSDW